MSQINVRQLLAALVIESKSENDLNVLSTVGKAEPDWLDKDDLEFLVSLIESPQKCNCINRVISSYIPDSKNMTVGNQAISIIEAYRNQEAFPNELVICRLYNREKVVEIKKWWEEYRKGKKQGI